MFNSMEFHAFVFLLALIIWISWLVFLLYVAEAMYEETKTNIVRMERENRWLDARNAQSLRHSPPWDAPTH